MRKNITGNWVCIFVASLITINGFAQNITLSGSVKNSTTKEPAIAVSIIIKSSDIGTFTNDKGIFSIPVKKLPVTLIISSVGYQMQEVTVNNITSTVSIELQPTGTLGQEIVVSASRIPQKMLESPVSVERINGVNVHNSPAVSYYDMLSGLKGVDVTSSSLLFKTPSTRGFNGSGSLRVIQLMDGMDSQSPASSFSIGSVVGTTELDIDNIELLSGASSALYGSGGINGTILVTSKNPFKYQGLSVQTKVGMMNVDEKYRNISPYQNWNMRWAKKVSDKFAFKIAGDVTAAKEWLGYDYRNYLRTGTTGRVIDGNRVTDPNYDGINVYGDEVSADIRGILNLVGANNPFLKDFIDTLNSGRPINVSRTGYQENQVLPQNAYNYKISGALHYKINNKMEAVLAGNWGMANAIYTTARRSSFKDFYIGQYKLELNHKNWMFRTYTVQENAGNSHDATITSILFNESWKPSGGETGWFATYTQTYLGARLAGASDFEAHQAARAASDVGRPEPGSATFKNGYDAIRNTPVSKGGSLVVSKSNLYVTDGQYNLSHLTNKVIDLLVGGNYRRFNLNSKGNLFADSAGKIGINEWGGFLQVSRSLLDDYLRLTFTGRYDKNQNFKGRFTPRATALIKVADNNHIRLGYQTAYRFPSAQQQWIDLNIGANTRFIGGIKDFRTYYELTTKPTFLLSGLPANNTPYQFSELKPESVSMFELGYKGLLLKDKLLLDAYGYSGRYQNFIARTLLIQPFSGEVNDVLFALSNGIPLSNVGRMYSIPVNATAKVKTYGFGLGIDYRLPHNFTIGVNASSDDIADVPDGFTSYFSTPKYRTNISVGNNGFGYKKRMGFNVGYRWQDRFYSEGEFASATLPAIHTIDAQISYRFPIIKSFVRLGANNLLNQYYVNGVGNSMIGGLYYVGFGYNVF